MGQNSQSQSLCLIFQVLRDDAQQVGRERWNRAVFQSSVSKFLVAISPAPGAGPDVRSQQSPNLPCRALCLAGLTPPMDLALLRLSWRWGGFQRAWALSQHITPH